MYIKQTWTNGDLITANKLNHIELGIEENQLPEITANDIGKYLIGVPDFEHPIGSYTICPQQTVTLTNSFAELTYESFSSIPQQVLVTVNGTMYGCDISGGGGEVYNLDGTQFDTAPYYAVGFDDRTMKWMFSAYSDDNFETIASGNYTVKIEGFESPGVKWGLGYPSGGMVPYEPYNPIAE